MQKNQPQSRAEEVINALTHLLSSLFFIFLAITSGTIWETAYSTIFSVMFFASFLYHAETPWKSSFRLVDQFFIYVVIGASGLLVPDSLEPGQVVFFLSILSLTFVHHVMRQVLSIPEGYTVPLLYLGNGIICSYFLLSGSSYLTPMLWCGIFSYLIGFFFYINDHVRYFHSIWHVMCGTGAYLIYDHLSSLS